MGIFLIALVGYLRYGQALDTPALLGICFIIIGIIILRIYSKSLNI